MLEMLYGAMDELAVSDPWDVATDAGPVIDAEAMGVIQNHVEAARREGRVLKELDIPGRGTFCAPTAIRIDGIGDLEREIFGPVLHVATFKASQIDTVIDAINATGYGLTFGLHSRIDDRVEHVTSRIRAGTSISTATRSAPLSVLSHSAARGCRVPGRRQADPITSTASSDGDAPRNDGTDVGAGEPGGSAGDDRSTDMPRAGTFDRRHAWRHRRIEPVVGLPPGVVLCLGPTAADATTQQNLPKNKDACPSLPLKLQRMRERFRAS